jgi:RNA polymerase sigma factor (sigma-70 family)
MKAPPPITPERLAELAAKAQAGTLNDDDKKELILGHTRLAKTIAQRFAQGGRMYMAEDLESEALLAIVSAVNKSQGNVHDINKWITAAIRNRLAKLTTRLRSEEPLNVGLNKTDQFRYDEEEENLCRDEIDKKILRCRFDGMSDREIAQELGISETAIKKRRYAMQRRYEGEE